MFYTTEEGHPFAHNPIGAIVSPRPIAWISTRDTDGLDNLAPYSFFNLIAYEPAQVMFASVSGKTDQLYGKDTLTSIEDSGVFCINVAEAASLNAVNHSSGSFNKDEDEFQLAGVNKTECNLINCPRVHDAPASLECKLNQIIKLEGKENYLVLGNIVGVHIRENSIKDGRFDVESYQPLTRLGYKDYAIIEKTFEAERHD